MVNQIPVIQTSTPICLHRVSDVALDALIAAGVAYVQMLDWLTAAEELKNLEEEQHGAGQASDSAARFEALVDNLVGDEPSPDEQGVIEGALRHLNIARR